MKKEGKTFDEICDYIAKKIGYDDTVSYFDIADFVESERMVGINSEGMSDILFGGKNRENL